MKIALVHELLTMRGGAERMLRVVADMFPNAPIYTLLYDEKKLGSWFPKERVRTSTVQKYANVFGFNHHQYLPFFPKAVEAWNFSEFDLVLSFSSAFVHGIRMKGVTKHICYVNSPARYLWDQTFDVLDRVKNPLTRKYLERIFHILRQWDAQAADRPHKLLVSSKAVQRRVELYWRRESEVVYPPVDIENFPLYEGPRDEYYVIASTLISYKRIELAIEACAKLGRKLKIVGEGPHRRILEKFASQQCFDMRQHVIPSSPSAREGISRDSAGATPDFALRASLGRQHDVRGVEFLGYKDHVELVHILQHARAFLFPGEEDFGIAPVEAMACGTPVIAYRGGGALETVLEGETGGFFSCHAERSAAHSTLRLRSHEARFAQDDISSTKTKHELVDALITAIQKFEQKSYSSGKCRQQAQNFSKKIFKENLTKKFDKNDI